MNKKSDQTTKSAHYSSMQNKRPSLLQLRYLIPILISLLLVIFIGFIAVHSVNVLNQQHDNIKTLCWNP